MAENSSNTASGSHRSGAKRLIIMRHAEADWGLNDFDRPLTKRGHEQAAAAGAWLASRGYIPEQIMSSSALRTRQTTTWVSDGLGAKAPTAHLDEGLYEVSASRIIARINSVSENVHSLMVVSHLPGVQDAVQRLMGPDSDPNASMDVYYGFPPSSIAVFEVPGSGLCLMARMRASWTSRASRLRTRMKRVK